MYTVVCATEWSNRVRNMTDDKRSETHFVSFFYFAKFLETQTNVYVFILIKIQTNERQHIFRNWIERVKMKCHECATADNSDFP